VGWIYARVGVANHRGRRLQIIAGAAAVLLVCVAWFLALSHSI
jgi:hypothetical protein